MLEEEKLLKLEIIYFGMYEKNAETELGIYSEEEGINGGKCEGKLQAFSLVVDSC